MAQSQFQTNHIVTYKNNDFEQSFSITQPQMTYRQEADYLYSKIEQKQYSQSQEQSINTYYYDYSQIIHEPEYFLNTQNLKKEKSHNQIIEISDQNNNCYVKYLDCDTFWMNYDHKNHQYSIQNSQQQFQNNQSMFLSSKSLNKSSLGENDCKDTGHIQFKPCQHNSQGKENIQYKSQNALELQFEENETNNSSTFQRTDSKNNQFQIELTEERKAADVIQNKEGKNRGSQNSLKNIVHAFIKHFKQLKDCKKVMNLSSLQLQNYKKQLVRYMKQHSFNYSVVKYLTTHKIYKLLLQNFLQNNSSEWLFKSKVIDKQEVQKQILFLNNCIVDEKYLEELIDY
ncbi:hypothetical protein ABPG74_016070 [Tetrahymena malaccensis]